MNAAVIIYLALVGPSYTEFKVQETSAEQRFREAQAIFDQARGRLSADDSDPIEARKEFHQAATLFADLANEGVHSANLYINTGNAYNFAGDHPRALLWYLRAEKLTNTPQARNGVATLRRVCGADLWPHQQGSIGRALMFWHFDVSRRIKQWILILAYPVGWLMLIGARFAGRRAVWMRLSVVLIIVGAIMGISDAVAVIAPGDKWGVVLENAKGYAGNGEEYSVTVDKVIPGQEVKIIEPRNGWLHIELPLGTKCWLPADTCQEF